MTSRNMADSTLIEDIDSQATSDFESGRANHLADLWCTIGGVVTSVAAAILAGTPAYTWITASFAALPAACLILQQAVDFRGRADWYFLKASKLRGISLALRHEGLAVELGSKQFRETEIEMEQKWSSFVKRGHAPATKL